MPADEEVKEVKLTKSLAKLPARLLVSDQEPCAFQRPHCWMLLGSKTTRGI